MTLRATCSDECWHCWGQTVHIKEREQEDRQLSICICLHCNSVWTSFRKKLKNGELSYAQPLKHFYGPKLAWQSDDGNCSYIHKDYKVSVCRKCGGNGHDDIPTSMPCTDDDFCWFAVKCEDCNHYWTELRGHRNGKQIMMEIDFDLYKLGSMLWKEFIN